MLPPLTLFGNIQESAKIKMRNYILALCQPSQPTYGWLTLDNHLPCARRSVNLLTFVSSFNPRQLFGVDILINSMSLREKKNKLRLRELNVLTQHHTASRDRNSVWIQVVLLQSAWCFCYTRFYVTFLSFGWFFFNRSIQRPLIASSALKCALWTKHLCLNFHIPWSFDFTICVTFSFEINGKVISWHFPLLCLSGLCAKIKLFWNIFIS